MKVQVTWKPRLGCWMDACRVCLDAFARGRTRGTGIGVAWRASGRGERTRDRYVADREGRRASLPRRPLPRNGVNRGEGGGVDVGV